MNRAVYVLNSLLFYRRTHVGVVLGTLFAAAVLVGALAVGDSVRYSLTRLTLSRIGKTDVALLSQPRFFQATLADRMAGKGGGLTVAPVLLLSGVALSPEGDRRINDVQVVGVDDRFWALAPETTSPVPIDSRECLVNQAFADRLGAVAPGGAFILRIARPGGLPMDLALAAREDDAWAARLTVGSVLDPASFGHFSLRTTQSPPPTAVLPLSRLSAQLGIDGRANALLIHDQRGTITIAELRRRLDAVWQLDDAGLYVEPLADGTAALHSDRVFIEPAVAQAARQAVDGAAGVITYFVNSISFRNRATPYSFVSAPPSDRLPVQLEQGEILIADWLAADLGVAIGDHVTLTYYVVDSGVGLDETDDRFTVAGIVSLDDIADTYSDLTPAIPGLTDVDNCRDWDPGIPIELERIRAADEEYWNDYGALPKAVVNRSDAVRMWRNRFGTDTSIHFPETDRPPADIAAAIRRNLSPGELGFMFQSIRETGLAASRDAVDFGQLFVGLSFFLIVAAVLLTALLFAFSVQFRAEETGTLRAVGFLPKTVHKLLLAEALVLVIVGAALGGVAALGYNVLILRALQTIWHDAVRTSAFQPHIRPGSVAAGVLTIILTAVTSMTVAVRRQARLTICDLQRHDLASAVASVRQRRIWLGLGLTCVSAAIVLVVFAAPGRGRETTGVFFAAGGLLLAGLLALCNQGILLLQAMTLSGSDRTCSDAGRGGSGCSACAAEPQPGPASTCSRPQALRREFGIGFLAVSGAAIRRGRSLACIALMALGVFLVIAVAANRRAPLPDPGDPAGGSGGYRLWGRATMPLNHDLNSDRGQAHYGLSEAMTEDVAVAQLRLHEGDDASCLNLNRVQSPHLIGVDSALFARRGAFTFVRLADGMDLDNPWLALDKDLGPDVIPGVADQADITWGLGKTIGDTLTYTDETGRALRVKLVGGLANSIFQGHVLISEAHFVARFPSSGGYRILLIDAPPNRAAELQATLTRRLSDVGLACTTTRERLAEFNSVENTYLSIFMILGGLGILVGSAGMGIVAARNILERRSELALLRAVGFTRCRVRRLLLFEHAALAAVGIAVGVIAALVAAAPALLSPDAVVPWQGLALTLVALTAGSMLWIWAAVYVSLRGDFLPALRKE